MGNWDFIMVLLHDDAKKMQFGYWDHLQNSNM